MQLQAINHESDAYDLSVEITENGEVVYERAVEIPSAADESTGLGDGKWSGVAFEGYPTEPGSYILHTWRGDQSKEDAVTLDFAAYDQECVQVRVYIGDAREDSGAALSIWRSFDCSTVD
ncbi:hypothetical protein [Natrialba taiwanensis]|uniref:hypothetical protein n=1 Tax=Natrialba taiwanensis TaxID=160846 RepID=UPI0009FFEAD8|nr:hypothetical protein [Natrialba taiwanensis]